MQIMNIIKKGVFIGAGLLLAISLNPGMGKADPFKQNANPLPGGTLDPTTIPKFVTPLVIPPVMPESKEKKADYNISMRQFKQQILPGGI